MKQALGRVAFALVVGLVSPPALTQTSPAPSAEDAAMAAQKAAFLALPEATRKAAQEALVWLGLYVGVNDGEFGKRTRDAILAFQASVKAPADGALSPPSLNALLAAGQKARNAAGVQIVSDPKTGAKIGAPLKLLNAGGGARLDFASNADPDLGALYTRLSATTPARKIAYKAIKPDAFFVVSGQDGTDQVLHPLRQEPGGEPADPRLHLRLSGLAGAPISTGLRSPSPIRSSRSRDLPLARAATATPRRPHAGAIPPPAAPAPAATALVVAPGKALTALKADDCPNPTVGGKPVRIERADAATGLAMLAGDFASNGEAPRLGPPAQDLVILGFAGPRLAASSASFASGGARPIVTAALDKSAGGGPVFDRRGALVGLVAPIAGEPKRVAGVALAAPHALIAPTRSAPSSATANPRRKRAPLSAGDIAAREKKALLAVFCRK